MYCVKCGVKLQDNISVCPLCGTKVAYIEENNDPESHYSEIFPDKRYGNMTVASILTSLCLISIVTILIVCFNVYNGLAWGGYVIFAILLFYCIFVLPLWFYKPNFVIFIPIDHLAIALYLLYICTVNHGHWFLSFAMPVTLISCILFTTTVVLTKYVKKGGYFITGGILIFTGLSAILIEFFEHITFNTKMFIWSLYVAGSLSIIGLFLIFAGIFKPLHNYLNKRFFI